MKKLGIFLCSASGLATVALGFVYTQRLEAEVSGGPKVPVLVAATDIPVSATLTEKQLAVRDIPRAYVESRHIRSEDLKKVVGQRVIEGLKTNEALLTSDVAKFSERKTLSGLVATGMRAVSIEGRSANFDGLLRPGDRVDVLLSRGAQEDSAGATITLLQNLLILSVGGTTDRTDLAEKTYGRGATVTVSTSVEQAQILTEAMRRGKLTLALRNSEDITLVEGVAETDAKSLASRSNDQPMRAATPVAASPSPIVNPLSGKVGPSNVR